MPKKPWEYENALSKDRIHYLAALIDAGRQSALEDFNPLEGDDSWTLGCLAYKRSCFQIIAASHAESSDWLAVADPGMAFVFSIGSIPCRFFHGEPEDPQEKRLYRNAVEGHQFQLSFWEESVGRPYVWRFVCETNSLGATLQVSCIGYSDVGHVLAKHDVKADEMPTVFRKSGSPSEFADADDEIVVTVLSSPDKKSSEND